MDPKYIRRMHAVVTMDEHRFHCSHDQPRAKYIPLGDYAIDISGNVILLPEDVYYVTMKELPPWDSGDNWMEYELVAALRFLLPEPDFLVTEKMEGDWMNAYHLRENVTVTHRNEVIYQASRSICPYDKCIGKHGPWYNYGA